MKSIQNLSFKFIFIFFKMPNILFCCFGSKAKVKINENSNNQTHAFPSRMASDITINDGHMHAGSHMYPIHHFQNAHPVISEGENLPRTPAHTTDTNLRGRSHNSNTIRSTAAYESSDSLSSDSDIVSQSRFRHINFGHQDSLELHRNALIHENINHLNDSPMLRLNQPHGYSNVSTQGQTRTVVNDRIRRNTTI